MRNIFLYVLLCLLSIANTYAIHLDFDKVEGYNYADIAVSIDTQNSICLNSGSATINATGGTGTYTYEVLTTPAGFIFTSNMLNGNVLSGLALGNYKIRVRDTAGAFFDQDFTIGGNPYKNMDPTASTQLICNGVELVINPGIDYFSGTSLGVPPYRYSLISGPGITSETPLQTSNKFLVTPGTYTYKVYDSCDAFQTRTFQVNIAAKQAEIHYSPYNSALGFSCNNGIIDVTFSVGNLHNQEGYSYGFDQPFHYKLFVDNVLVDTDSITWWNDIYFTKNNYTLNTSIQYSLEATNKCGVTEMFTGTLIFDLPEPPSLEIISFSECDNTTLHVKNKKQHATYELLDSNDVIIATNTYGSFSYTNTPGMVVGNSYKIREIPCFGASRVTELKVLPSPTINVEIRSENCSFYYILCYNTPAPNPFKLQLFLANDLNTIVAEKTGIANEIRSFKLSDSNAIIPGQNYVVRAIDLTTSLIQESSPFIWEDYVVSPFVPGHHLEYQSNSSFPSMYLNTVRVLITAKNLASSGKSWITNTQIINGTATSLTRADGTVIPINYPLPSGSAYNLPIGTYDVQAEGVYECENRTHTFQFEVTKDMVQEEPLYDNITFSSTVSCPSNSSSIQLSITNLRPKVFSNIEKFYYASLYLYDPVTGVKIPLTSTDGNYYLGNTIGLTKNFSEKISNSASGNYKLYLDYHKYNSADYETYGFPIPQGTRGDVVELGGTYVVKVYEQPKIESLIVNECVNGTRNIIVKPEIDKGVAPYNYAILSGPNGFSAANQSSPEFNGLQPGLYQFRLEDSCGNAVTQWLDVANFTPPAFETVGNSCEGETVTFTFPNVPYYSYTWILPDNSTKTGNSLTINNISNSAAGLYTVTINSLVGGCTSSVTKQYLLDPCYGLVEPNKKNARVNPNLRQRVKNSN